MATQKATGTTFESELDPVLQFKLEQITSPLGYPGKTLSVACCAYLTDCTSSLLLESQLPHKIVNLLFTFAN